MEVYEKFHNRIFSVSRKQIYSQKIIITAAHSGSLPYPSSREGLVGNEKVIQLQDYFIIDLFSKTTNKIAR